MPVYLNLLKCNRSSCSKQILEVSSEMDNTCLSSQPCSYNGNKLEPNRSAASRSGPRSVRFS